MTPEKIHVVFVCLGNICRSPVAEGTFHHLVEKKGLESHFQIDSAGTSAWHIGQSANKRSIKVAQRHGIKLTSLARQFTPQDFNKFDYIIAMDRSNYQDIIRLSQTKKDKTKVEMMRKWDNLPYEDFPGDVPDPYYGGNEGFENVQNILINCCSGFLDHLIKTHKL